MRIIFIRTMLALGYVTVLSCANAAVSTGPSHAPTEEIPTKLLPHSEDEWKALLSDPQFQVLRRHGTETAFSGVYWKNHRDGTYLCAGCGHALFDSSTKFESGTGWPSFFRPLNEHSVETASDTSVGMERTEVHCAHCGGHLGHVFNDGPKPTGLRYCMNSIALTFLAREDSGSKP